MVWQSKEGANDHRQNSIGDPCAAAFILLMSNQVLAPYEPIGDLKLEFPGHLEFRNYRRELDLETAVAKVSYNSGEVNFTREVFVSRVDQVIVVRLRCDHPKQISFFASLVTVR